MYKLKNKKIKIAMTICILFVSIFLCSKIYAVTDDDGPDVSSDNIVWTFTYYGGERLGTGLTRNDFSINDTYGWYEYDKDGTKYVVLAGATHELLKAEGYERFDRIHYFNYYDTVQFKFKDSDDDKIYNGMILDSCGASMNPTEYGRADNVQILDVFYPSEDDEKGRTLVSGKEITLTMDGTFSPTVGKKSSYNRKTVTLIIFSKLLSAIGDTIQGLINFTGTDLDWNESTQIVYSRSEIEENERLNRYIKVGDAEEVSDDKDTDSTDNTTTNSIDNGNTNSTNNTPINKNNTVNTSDADTEEKNEPLGKINIPCTIENRAGEKENVFTAGTGIPVIPVDIYTSSINKVELFDIDFFSKSNLNSNKYWKMIRSIVVGVSHVVMYISAGLILTIIIYRSILLVVSSLGDDPEGAAEAKKIMDNLVKSILIISMVYAVLILMVYGYKAIFNWILRDNDSSYLIRANVEKINSFNTNLLGILKYKSLTENVYSAFSASLVYLLAEVLNLIYFGMMFVRMHIMAILTIVAPVTAVHSMVGGSSTSGLEFKRFIKCYGVILFLPLILVVIWRLAFRIF